MRFDSIELTNYRCHRKLHVEFKLGFNVIVGINGSGKTSILNALCDSLSGFMCNVNLKYGGYLPLAKEDLATNN